MYQCQHFSLHELLPRVVYQQRGEKGWALLDERLLVTLDRLRKRYGSITVNNWLWGGEREWSGLRTPDSPFYSRYSQHSFGRAADCLFGAVTVDEVREDILTRLDEPVYQYIQSVEMGVSWLHFDVRNGCRVETYWP